MQQTIQTKRLKELGIKYTLVGDLETNEEVERNLAQLRASHNEAGEPFGVPPLTDESVAQWRAEFLLQWHYGGREIAEAMTEKGRAVLASGTAEEVMNVVDALPEDIKHRVNCSPVNNIKTVMAVRRTSAGAQGRA